MKTIDRVVIYCALTLLSLGMVKLVTRPAVIFVINPKPVTTSAQVFLPMFYRK